jgi:MFS family permease
MAHNMTAVGTEGLSAAPADPARLRRVVRLVCVIVFVDTIYFALVAPLLPSLVHELHLSKLSAGILTGALAAGNVIGSIPSGVFAARAGSRSATVAGLTLLGATSIAFGLGTNIVVLDVARFFQGVAEALTWAGAFTWVVAEAPVERRGSVLGVTLATAGAGALFGPVLGTIAHLLGRGIVFVAFAAVPFGLAVIAHIYGTTTRAPIVEKAAIVAALRNRVILIGGWLVLLGGGAQAIVTTLAPLRVAAMGGTATAIGVAFLASAGLESMASLLSGRVSDRHGRWLPLLAGLIAGTVLLPCVALADTQLLVAAVVVLIGGSVGLLWPSALAAISDAADSAGIPQGIAFSIGNLTWGLGATIGAFAGGAIAKAAGDGVALGSTAALWGLSAVLLGIRSGAGRGSL